jgi:small subunit ribosomal protein S1
MEENQINNPNAEGQESAPVAQTEATEATTATSNVPVQEPVEERVVTAHDDFDWSIDKRNVSSYSKE